uniref:M20/M25/M40 family metallo-hydrolase n=1 Tax=Ammonifex degensii TaxID=42838 RepID=A0A7C2EBF1_9THEO
MVNPERLLHEFLELCRVDSVSGQERQLCDLLKARLGALGLTVREDQAGAFGNGTAGNIIAHLPATVPDRPRLLFCAHMDTVEPGRGVKPVVGADGIIRSAGDTILGADDKAGIAAVIEAIRVVQENKLAHSGVTVVFTIREETGLVGAKALDAGIQADYGFVLDATGQPGEIVVRAPSQDKLTATVYGRAAHAGVNPEAGINAIYVAAQAIAAMQLGRIDPETTANIGTINGGKAVNIVPDTVYLEGEVRSLKKERRAAHTALICRILEETAQKAGARVEVNVELLYEGFDLSAAAPVVRFTREAMSLCGLEPVLTQSGGGSDANILNARGIPTVNLATGMENVHTTGEEIAVADLVALTRLVLELIRLAGNG